MTRLLVLLALGAAACGPPTAVRITLSSQAGGGLSDVRLFVYDRFGAVVRGAQLAGAGDVAVLLSDGAGRARAVARATDDSGAAVMAAGAVDVKSGGEVPLALVLGPDALADLDGDGVPDVIDDCPATPDPDQTSSAGGPQGDACAGGGADMNPPPVGCGDGTVATGEACDDGPANSDDPMNTTATCTTHCQKRAPCGVIGGAARMAKVDPDTGHCYVAWNTPLAWASAEYDCEKRGGRLVAVGSAGEDALVHSIAGGGDLWIGMWSGTAKSWTTGEAVSYTAFSGTPAGAPNTCVATSDAGHWVEAPCAYPSSGALPPTTGVALPYVCEHACGNGVLDPGEECEPSDAGCTTVCRRARPCTEPGGKVSAASGHCFFTTGTAGDYAAAAAQCPSGTHLATVEMPAEEEAALAAVGATAAPAWIAIHATTSLDSWAWEAMADLPFEPGRYHGFYMGEPNEAAAPACARVDVGTGWKDRICATVPFVSLCERE